ncbi:glycosyltransferase [Phycicoccus sp. Soil803]|uniref:glycosyltransferase n=1 Tax=Phycicoccus sp. Soil803 TaxID=1736415 RepID=UPI00070DDF68|nr:glycosyltransferase [Phycicoccus sp. Soil803]KRF23264.1 hypothetical protein ASG95_00635 [Phycicoccus sp. Soil803]
MSGQVLYESYFGGGLLCSPRAIFEQLLDDDEFDHLTHVWVVSSAAVQAQAVAEFGDHPRVRFVRFRSAEYFRALATSEYLINNSTFPPEFRKRDGQTYVNTWHGTPLKRMGYDSPGGASGTRNVIRNMMMVDYLLSSGPFMTSGMYERGYKLRGIFPGKVVEAGTPRVDSTLAGPDSPVAECARSRLEAGGVRLRGRKLLVYAPTWHGDYYRPTNDVLELAHRVRSLSERLGDEWRVVVKVHQRAFPYARSEPALKGMLVPDDLPTNTLLAVADALVTDYSSIFYDFLPTGRPVLFLAPDVASYAASRGLYDDPDEWPGPVVATVGQLADHVLAIGTGGPLDPCVTHADRYARALSDRAPLEDGRATRRVIDLVFRGIEPGCTVHDGLPDERTSILIYLGGMLSNGITNSALNLLNVLDHDRYDVSVLYNHSRSREKVRNINMINPNVRVFPRIGGMTHSKRFSYGRRQLTEHGANARGVNMTTQRRILREEWERCFGSAHFDHVVDFSGYASFWALLLAQSGATTTSVFLHNDLMAETQKVVNGRRPHASRLPAFFSVYDQFDRLVSVSPALSEVNAANLGHYARPGAFAFASNTLDHDQVLRLAWGLTDVDRELFRPEAQALLRARPSSELVQSHEPRPVDLTNLPGTIEALLGFHPLSDVRTEVARRAAISSALPYVPDVVTFVTAGRLSPEKNHERLIRAFDIVHRQEPNTRLVIMGSGPLERSLVSLTKELGLSRAVKFTGQVGNPYAVMAQSDCFVLSSDYEGQPMVLLEALTLRLPIVTTRFPSVRGSLPEGVGYETDLTPEALADGMSAFLRGAVDQVDFDYVAYNQIAAHQFLSAIGAEPALGNGIEAAFRRSEDWVDDPSTGAENRPKIDAADPTGSRRQLDEQASTRRR